MRSLIARPALTYDDRDYTYADLVLVGVVDGRWPEFEVRIADGIAAGRVLADAGTALDPAAVKSALVAFRKRRGLIAGDDFRAWRDARGLESQDVTGHLERELARAHVAHEELADHRPDSDEVVASARVDAICSGLLGELAQTLLQWAAAERGLGRAPDTAGDPALLVDAARACAASGLDAIDDLTEHASAIVRLYAAYEQFATEVASDETVDRAIAAHGLGWQRFQWHEMTFTSESAAREAVMLVREDGLDFADVAQMSGSPAHAFEGYFDELDKQLGGVLVSTEPGTLAGPLPADGNGAWRLLQVTDRTLAQSTDPVLRARAREELIEDALERHLVGRVRLHGEF